MGHARPDTANVGDVLLAEPHRVWFAGRALLRGPLLRGGGRRRECEREAQKRRSGYDRPEVCWVRMCIIVPPSGFCPGIYCYATTMASKRRRHFISLLVPPVGDEQRDRETTALAQGCAFRRTSQDIVKLLGATLIDFAWVASSLACEHGADFHPG
jgi:hypothetical protein